MMTRRQHGNLKENYFMLRKENTLIIVANLLCEGKKYWNKQRKKEIKCCFAKVYTET
jgi:hypothetical protein